MYVALKDLKGYTIQATDGSIGKVDEFLFDDEMWTVRYLVVNTGDWLTSRLVLISPTAITGIDRAAKTLSVALTRSQVEASPDISTDRPISRQAETVFLRYYDYPLYWRSSWIYDTYLPANDLANLSGAGTVTTSNETTGKASGDVAQDQSHLRSSREVAGYRIMSHEGEIGHVSNFIIDDSTWSIRYLAIETGRWWSGKTVLLPPQWASAIHLTDRTVTVNVPLELIKDGPTYDQSSILNYSYEARLFFHYRRSINMFTTREQFSKSLIDITTGKKVGAIYDLILDDQITKITGVILMPAGLIRRTYMGIDRASVTVMGVDVWLSTDMANAVPVEQLEKVGTSQRASEIFGREIQTEGGTKVGTVGDIILNEQGDVLGFEMKNVFVQGPIAERKTIAREAITAIGSKENPMTTVLEKAEMLSPGTLPEV